MIVARFQRWGIVLVLRVMLYMFVRYLLASDPRCLRCLMFMLSGLVELLFVLCEMANSTCVMVSCIFSAEKFLIVCVSSFFCAIWNDVRKLFIKSFCFVYVSDDCFCTEAKTSVLLCWIVLLWYPIGSVNCVCDQFC